MTIPNCSPVSGSLKNTTVSCKLEEQSNKIRPNLCEGKSPTPRQRRATIQNCSPVTGSLKNRTVSFNLGDEEDKPRENPKELFREGSRQRLASCLKQESTPSNFTREENLKLERISSSNNPSTLRKKIIFDDSTGQGETVVKSTTKKTGLLDKPSSRVFGSWTDPKLCMLNDFYKSLKM